MNCPSRRESVLYPISGGSRTFNDANPVSMVARGDYAVCMGDLSNDEWGGGPGSFADAKSATFAWPTIAATATGISYVRSQVTVAMITDGLSNTYMLGERYICPDYYTTGTDPADNETMYTGMDNDTCRTVCYVPMQDTPGLGNTEVFGSAHAGSLNMSFCDGSVQTINYSIDAETHRRLGNRCDDLPVDRKNL